VTSISELDMLLLRCLNPADSEGFTTCTVPVRFDAELRSRIRRIRMFLGFLDPDPLVRGMDPDPDQDPSITQK
jgi:hypothetical protein